MNIIEMIYYRLKRNNKIRPSGEIWRFLSDTFEIGFIKAKVGKKNAIVFHVRSKESNHSIPHVHAKFGKYEISIAIKDGRVLAGNLPHKNQKIAQQWVLDNQEKLINDWKNLAISLKVSGNVSFLDKPEINKLDKGDKNN